MAAPTPTGTVYVCSAPACPCLRATMELTRAQAIILAWWWKTPLPVAIA